jgi:hypothetical protein
MPVLTGAFPTSPIQTYADPTIPGTITPRRKDGESGAEGAGVPGLASKTPDEPRPMVESAPSPPLPPKSPESPLKRPPNKPKILC